MTLPKRGDVIRRDPNEWDHWYAVVTSVSPGLINYVHSNDMDNAVTGSEAKAFNQVPGWCYANPNDKAHSDVPEVLWEIARRINSDQQRAVRSC